MNEIKHDDEWLYEHAPSSSLHCSSTDYGDVYYPDPDLMRFARQYLEHMTRVRVTADELPDFAVEVLGIDGETSVVLLADHGNKKMWLEVSSLNSWDLSVFPHWQTILRSGGGV